MAGLLLQNQMSNYLSYADSFCQDMDLPVDLSRQLGQGSGDDFDGRRLANEFEASMQGGGRENPLVAVHGGLVRCPFAPPYRASRRHPQ